MVADKTDVSFMQEYLAQAVEFEKYVYIWSNAMANANSRMRDIYSRRGKLEEIRDSSRSALDSLSDNIKRCKAALGRAAKSYKRKATVALVITLVDFAICLIACFVALRDSAISLRLFMSAPTFLSTIIGPVALNHIYQEHGSPKGGDAGHQLCFTRRLEAKAGDHTKE